jgi:uncharacterized protein YjbI with pentapeptide repeats
MTHASARRDVACDTQHVDVTSCGRPHHAAPPGTSHTEPASHPPTDCDGDIGDLWLKDARVLELDLDRPEILDVRLEDCDLSGVVATGFVARRVALERTRIRGVTLVKGQFDDGLLTGCVSSDLSFRFSRLRRVVFRDCDLSGADFYNVAFDHVTIDGCDLRRAHFDAATVSCLAITSCDLAGVTGVAGLKGAQLDASDLPNLAQSMASETGILIRDA